VTWWTMSKEEQRVTMATKVAAAQAILEAEIVKLHSGEDWLNYLDFAAKLHAYSPNNAQLITLQHSRAFEEGRVEDPCPGFVAGFNTWRAFGRQVKKGQRGYAVLAPVRYMQRSVASGDGVVRVLRPGESLDPGDTEHIQQVLCGFKVEYVFSQSQTAGVALPEPPMPKLLEGEGASGLGEAVMNLVTERGFMVTAASLAELNGANGVTDFMARSVRIREDMDDAAMVKTMIHEAAHVLLHETAPGSLLDRPRQEVEAESVAFIVAAAHGMSSGDYSFPYVAAWAGPDPAKVIAQTQARVSQAAKVILGASPAPHTTGGKVPGIELALARAGSERNGDLSRLEQTDIRLIGNTDVAAHQ
jgi:hypothetical protein